MFPELTPVSAAKSKKSNGPALTLEYLTKLKKEGKGQPKARRQV